MTPLNIGHYELTGIIGAGGMGEVYSGIDIELKRPVAIKVLRPELANDPNLLERFLEEARSLGRLHHPNITTLYSIGHEDQKRFMVMEMVRGHTLESILKKQQLSLQECLSVVAQMISGVSYAHNEGVIHRDIKPSNLKITDTGIVKLMDFGIARVRGSKRLTRTGSIIGTPAYMSPEQVRGEEGDERSDLYSLAIVLYEMLSGTVPFDAKSEFEIHHAHLETPPPPLQGRVPGLTHPIEAALMRALAKGAPDRFSTVDEFGEALGISEIQNGATATLRRTLALSSFAEPETRLILPNDIDELEKLKSKNEAKHSDRGAKKNSTSKPLQKPRNYLPLVALGASVSMLIAVGGFILMTGIPNGQESSLAHIPPSPQPASSMEPEIFGEISGNVSNVIDSNAMFVNGTLINLYGLTDPQEPGTKEQQKYVAATKDILARMGNNVQCTPKGGSASTYQCIVKNQDLGILVLENGMAKTTDEAPPDYLAAEHRAQSAHRGLWGFP